MKKFGPTILIVVLNIVSLFLLTFFYSTSTLFLDLLVIANFGLTLTTISTLSLVMYADYLRERNFRQPERDNT